jgi:hypothetical protein
MEGEPSGSLPQLTLPRCALLNAHILAPHDVMAGLVPAIHANTPWLLGRLA